MNPVQDPAQAGRPCASPWVMRLSLSETFREPALRAVRPPAPPPRAGTAPAGRASRGARRFLVGPDVDLPAAAAGVPRDVGLSLSSHPCSILSSRPLLTPLQDPLLSASPHTPAGSSPPRLQGFAPGIGSLRPFPRPPHPSPPRCGHRLVTGCLPLVPEPHLVPREDVVIFANSQHPACLIFWVT